MRHGTLHLRLILFFVLLTALGTWFGWTRLQELAGPETVSVPLADARSALALAVAAVGLAGLLGVLVHRLTVLPQKQREIERYVRGVEQESAKVRALLEGAVDLLWVTERSSGRVLDCNELARRRLGVRTSAEAGSEAGSDGPVAVGELFAEEHRQTFEAAIADACARPGTPVEPAEVQVREPGGDTFPAALRIVAVELGEQTLVEVTLRDLTRQKELERQLSLHERMGSLGLLTASVAHEINNPLEGIANYLSLAEREGVDDEKRARYFEQIRIGFDRIRDLTRDLLRFARPEASSGSADLVQVVDRSVSMAAYAKQCAELSFERVGLDEPVLVVGDPARLEQVVINLLLNAGQASGGRGRVTIEAASSEDGVELTVADEGPGIAEADLGRVFDPFFTTSGGTGLGLSIVYGIVQAHGGELRAANRPGGGAAFTVRLRRSPASASSAGGASQANGAAS